VSIEKIKRGSNQIHPEKPSAVGSRNSLYREDRDEYSEASLLVNEEVDKILHHFSSKLPPEVLNKIDVMGGIKSKLHNYYNQNLQNMLNRYLVTVEDELGKQYRDMLDQAEFEQLNRYTPRMISDLLTKLGGVANFNTGSFEKSIGNIYGQMQNHIKQGILDLEKDTNSLLSQKHDVGGFVRKENAYAIVKCSFKNNGIKPKTVFDVKLALNILDAELFLPIYHYQKPLQALLKEFISDHIHKLLDAEIDKLNKDLDSDGLSELDSKSIIFEKFTRLEKYLSFESSTSDENNDCYDLVAKRFIDSLESATSEMPASEFDVGNIRDNVKHLLDKDNAQNRGFNYVVNSLMEVLDNTKLGYQYAHNMKNARVCQIREYTSLDQVELPDETFGIRLSYYDQDQLNEMRNAYDLQADELAKEIKKAMDVINKIYSVYTKEHNIISFEDVSKEVLYQMSKHTKTKINGNREEDDEDKLWNELVFVQPEEKENLAKTNINFTNILKRHIKKMKQKVVEIYKNQHPKERFILEERINFLEDTFQAFTSNINPHQLQQGLVLEIDITSVKRKRTTMDTISHVLNEFLYKVSKGFVDRSMQDYLKNNPLPESVQKHQFTSILQKMDESLNELKA